MAFQTCCPKPAREREYDFHCIDKDNMIFHDHEFQALNELKIINELAKALLVISKEATRALIFNL